MLLRLTRGFSKLTTLDHAVSLVRSESLLFSGGFGVCGVPETLLSSISRCENLHGLTVVSNNTGLPDYGVGHLLSRQKVKRMISSYLGTNQHFQDQLMAGLVELELTPQGTIAEKANPIFNSSQYYCSRAGGKGIPAFWTPTGVGTLVEKGGIPMKYSKTKRGEIEVFSKSKETQMFGGRKFLLEESLFADVAVVRAHKGDLKGNLSYRLSARNFNPDMASAAKIVIAEVEEIVEVGDIPPEEVHTPGVYVDWIVQADTTKQKPIEKLVLDMGEVSDSYLCSLRVKIAKRVAKEVKNNMSLNLGIGIPTLVPHFVDKQLDVLIHSENGVLGVEGNPKSGEEDADLVNASKETIRIGKGGSFFSSSDSFGIVRGGHIDLTILGAMEVSAKGDIANWIVPMKVFKGMGGAMDLISGGAKVIVAMEHCSKGQPKILESCRLPVTGLGCCSMIITELAVFDFSIDGQLTLLEIAEGSSLEEIRSKTAAKFIVHPQLR